jgi:ABC-2 type transport system ATP-binding protein
MANIIEVDNLTKIYDGKTVVDHISFSVKKGEIFGILGPNGAGKTTTLEMMETLREIDEGTALINGLDVSKEPQKIKYIIGVQPQSPAFQDKTKASEIIELFAAAYGQKVKPMEFLNDVNLGEKANSYVESLSGGQKQRASLSVALIGSPKLMVLDEPTIGLDPVLRASLWELFNKLTNQGTTILLSSHSMDEAERCDDLVLIRHGKLIAHSSPDDLKTETGSKTIEECFLKLVGDKKE